MLIRKRRTYWQRDMATAIGTAFTSKPEKLSRISPRDAPALRELSYFFDKITAARAAKENAKLVYKLPYHLDSKWRNVIHKRRFVHGKDSC